MTRYRFKKKIRKKMNMPNFIIVLIAIMASFLIVNISGAIQIQREGSYKVDSLVSSATRIADAFEIYNQKRFSQ